ncbi:hypothetical protein B5M19_02500 [Mesomycoplasma hyopneumoniae]|uniref:Transmembrane protein n=2 Tax=Mesomycoplasma hyopneumoniae (strain 168) TaxID=907287 RepID=E4QSN4_MESH1|nr:Predicted protein [Mesomycoplasma hyopneumoniae 168]AGM22011.1 hypothetical protein MHP168L_231 [Mesomycoplasma hyopneumoniae 168-L]MXR09984.1 hypothetical protein [Mesomycoplasma hyopneumoniae]MXR56104.1 hypothetical protein [Mesomycoplasma flocculare]OWY73823.1 hypothetical protein B5M19_02500 [Mesomycoplasma hyopneumoniae]
MFLISTKYFFSIFFLFLFLLIYKKVKTSFSVILKNLVKSPQKFNKISILIIERKNLKCKISSLFFNKQIQHKKILKKFRNQLNMFQIQ